MIIREKTFEAARKQIRKNKDKKIIFSSDNDELNRRILEKENIHILLLNQSGRKDWQKQRNSGFNQVMAKIAKKKNIAIGINLDEIIDTDGKFSSEVLARVKQNVRLAKKNKLKMNFISRNHDKDVYDLKSLGLVLGMPTWMTKNL